MIDIDKCTKKIRKFLKKNTSHDAVLMYTPNCPEENKIFYFNTNSVRQMAEEIYSSIPKDFSIDFIEKNSNNMLEISGLKNLYKDKTNYDSLKFYYLTLLDF